MIRSVGEELNGGGADGKATVGYRPKPRGVRKAETPAGGATQRRTCCQLGPASGGQGSCAGGHAERMINIV